MHRVAEYGIAAHWKYKENNNTKGLNKEEEKLSWLREVLEWQRDMDDNKEFLSLLKTNLDLFARTGILFYTEWRCQKPCEWFDTDRFCIFNP